MEFKEFINGVTPTFILTVCTALLGGVVWLIRLEGRIALLFEKILTQAQHEDNRTKLQDKYLQSQFESILEKINELGHRFERVESRLDMIQGWNRRGGDSRFSDKE